MKKFIETLKNCWKIEDLRQRLLITILFTAIYRFGSFVVLPGINPTLLEKLQAQTKGGLMSLLDMFSGGAFSHASIFALGIMPYISASIVMQLLAVAVPYFQKMQREGESGHKKINWYTRVLTVVILLFQAPSYLMNLKMQAAGALASGIDWTTFMIPATIILAAGSMFILWLGERITDKGVGNGISLIIFAGIVAGLPAAVGQTIEQARLGQMHFLVLLLIAVIVFAVTYFVVFVERGQRRIKVEYAKRQQGRQILGGHTSHLPLKVNMAGVIPAIFASSIILFPATLTQWVGQGSSLEWLTDLSMLLHPGQPLYLVIYAAAIIFFSFFYTAMQYNPRDTADNLKKSGAFIPGIRPGEQTSRYIDKIMTRLTLIGGLYVTFVCLVPYIMTSAWNVQFYFGGTSLLIVVVVIMDFIVQIQSHLMSTKYESALKKANLKGFGQ